MKQTINYTRLMPDTLIGDAVKVTLIYSSFNTDEIDKLEQDLKSKIGYGLIIEYEDEE